MLTASGWLLRVLMGPGHHGRETHRPQPCDVNTLAIRPPGRSRFRHARIRRPGLTGDAGSRMPRKG